MNILAGIVSYNPDIDRLTENIAAALRDDSVIKLLIVDNGSDNIERIITTVTKFPKVELIRNSINNGVAKALNQLCEKAVSEQADWIITLDQDSVISDNYVLEYSKYMEYENIGIISCRIEDRNFGRMHTKETEGWEYVPFCITSGCLMNLEAWRIVNGFDEKLFIDGVDFDYCLSLTEMGFNILRVNNVFLSHEIGHGKSVRLCGKTALVLNHPPIRQYYIARNYLYIGIKHNQRKKWRNEALKRMLLVAIYEKDKFKKIHYMVRGLRHAHRHNFGKR